MRARIGRTLAGLVGRRARIGYFVAYYFDDRTSDTVYFPSKDGTVTSIHILFDENIPSREEEYFQEINALKVKVAGNAQKSTEDFKHLIGTYHIDDESSLLDVINRIVVRQGLIVAYRSLAI